jgi:hypothetical protein
MSRRLAQVRRDVAPQTRRVRHELPPRFHQQTDFLWARGVLPAMSDTEREALEAGDVWWDADLFTGNPDWSKLLAVAPAT